jgi:ZIP family zinc transporter/zinc and cadmium transporter
LPLFSDILLKSILALISAVAGALLIFSIKLNHEKLCVLISFAAGALFSAALFTLLPESSGYLGWFEILIAAFSGYMLFWLISRYFSHVCPACSASHFDEQTTKKFSEIVLTLLTALSIHSFLDGVALTSGMEHQHQNQSVFIAVLTHKFPEGLALAALMISSGYTKSKIITYVILVELLTIAGAVTGYYFFRDIVSPAVISGVMAHIAGGFVYLALHAVLGEMLRNHKNLVIFSFSGGLLLIILVSLVV